MTGDLGEANSNSEFISTNPPALRATSFFKGGFIMTQNENLKPQKLDEERNENILRPSFLRDFLGQEKLKENLEIFIRAAKNRGEVLDHVLFYGPPGLGKTTLAYIISNELNVNIKTTSGPVIEKPGDLAAILTNLEEHDVLFIDEIHMLIS